MAGPFTYDRPPPIGTSLDWGGRRYVLDAFGPGVHYGKPYTKLTWRGACTDCGSGYLQTTPLAARRLASRCKACDPKGEKDAADRKAFMASRSAPKTPVEPPAQPGAAPWTLNNARLANGRLYAFFTEDGETVDVAWWPESHGYDTPGLNEALAKLHETLTAEAAEGML